MCDFLERVFVRPKYDGKFLHKKIEDLTGKLTLADTLTKILLPTFDVSSLNPMFFSSYENKREVKPKLSDVCIATSAALTYFPPHGKEECTLPRSALGGVPWSGSTTTTAAATRSLTCSPKLAPTWSSAMLPFSLRVTDVGKTTSASSLGYVHALI